MTGCDFKSIVEHGKRNGWLCIDPVKAADTAENNLEVRRKLKGYKKPKKHRGWIKGRSRGEYCTARKIELMKRQARIARRAK